MPGEMTGGGLNQYVQWWLPHIAGSVYGYAPLF